MRQLVIQKPKSQEKEREGQQVREQIVTHLSPTFSILSYTAHQRWGIDLSFKNWPHWPNFYTVGFVLETLTFPPTKCEDYTTPKVVDFRLKVRIRNARRRATLGAHRLERLGGEPQTYYSVELKPSSLSRSGSRLFPKAFSLAKLPLQYPRPWSLLIHEPNAHGTP